MVRPKQELKMRIYRVQTALPLAATMLGLSVISSLAGAITSTHSEQPLFQDLSQAQWKKMLPDLGDASPEIAILHVDPKTEATQLLIRTPKALHVRQHWHSANETHTMISGKATFACGGTEWSLGQAASITCRPAWFMRHGQRQVPSCLSPLTVPGT
jgi:hypothetical protein